MLSVNGSVFDLGILCVLGFAGYLMRRAGMPLVPAIVGLISAPMAERHFRRPWKARIRWRYPSRKLRAS